MKNKLKVPPSEHTAKKRSSDKDLSKVTGLKVLTTCAPFPTSFNPQQSQTNGENQEYSQQHPAVPANLPRNHNRRSDNFTKALSQAVHTCNIT